MSADSSPAVAGHPLGLDIERLDPLRAWCAELARVLAAAAGVEPCEIVRVLAPPKNPEMGDVALACHPFAKRGGVSPPELADGLAQAARGCDFVADAETAGPFLNIRWDYARLGPAALGAVKYSRETPGGLCAGDEGEGKRLVIEFSSPNAARKLGFHHLRGTIVGEALARLYAARGFDVTRLNFLGDFGHNIGQLLYMIDEHPEDADALEPAELQRLYVEANAREKDDPEPVKKAAGSWLDRLSDGDEVAETRWQMIVDTTKRSLDTTYERLGVTFDEYRGESRYFERALEVAGQLVKDGVAARDPEHGSIFVPETDGLQTIVLVNRRGMSTYEGRDLAAAIDRHADFDFDRCVYLTDVGQAGRFHAFFAALERDGVEWAGGLQHVGFGQMRIGGAKAKTRQGGILSADDVLDETVERAAAEIAERGMQLDDAEEVARKIGIGAVIFGQVRMRANADFEFDPEDAVSFKGDTAPRVQYTYARICSILDKAGSDIDEALDAAGDIALLTDELEHRVLAAILAMPAAARRACDADDPSHIADAVLAVADAWAAYQTAGARERPDLRVLSDDAGLRSARLALAAMSATAVRQGLGLLGVEVPERM